MAQVIFNKMNGPQKTMASSGENVDYVISELTETGKERGYQVDFEAAPPFIPTARSLVFHPGQQRVTLEGNEFILDI